MMRFAPLIMVTLLVACSKSDEQPKMDPSTNETASPVGSAPSAALTKLDASIPSVLFGQAYAIGGKCALDLVNAAPASPVAKIGKMDDFKVTGWAYDDQEGIVPPVAVFQLATDAAKFHAVLAQRTARPDVAKAFNNEKLERAGYDGDFDISAVPSGIYEVLVIMKTNSKNIVCDTYHKVEVSN